MVHEKYTITITFVVCDGTKDKALEEIKDLLHHTRLNSLGHVSGLKVIVSHEPTEE
jgi:hypothetical protein